MSLRLTDAQQEALRMTAEREQRSMQAVAAEEIEWWMSERNRSRDEIFAKIMDRDNDRLDRLVSIQVPLETVSSCWIVLTATQATPHSAT